MSLTTYYLDWPAPLLLLGLGALFVLFTYCFVWPIIKTLVNGVCSPYYLEYMAAIFPDSSTVARAIICTHP